MDNNKYTRKSKCARTIDILFNELSCVDDGWFLLLHQTLADLLETGFILQLGRRE